MRKYEKLLEEVRACFPEAKEVTINILTTEDERTHFSADIIQHCKDLGLWPINVYVDGVKKEIDSRFTFGKMGEIDVKSYPTTFEELFKGTDIAPKTDEEGNTTYDFKATKK